jgi:hypothetical protein
MRFHPGIVFAHLDRLGDSFAGKVRGFRGPTA